MKKEILIGIIVILVFALILQAAYIVGLRKGDNFKHVLIGKARIVSSPMQQGIAQKQLLSPVERETEAAMGEMFDPFEEMRDAQRRMRRDMERQERMMPMRLQPLRLSVNLDETENEYLITADMPGMKKEDIEIEIKKNLIIISGERKSEQSMEKEGVSVHEISAGKFSRAITLPQNIRKNEITSVYNNGVLVIKVPKDAPVKEADAPDIKIPVK